MSTFLVNGIEKPLPLPWESPLGDLIVYAQAHFNSEQSLVTTFKINGLEISAAEEVTLGGLPLNSCRTIEIETVHPKELAEETLQTLLPFLEQLAKVSERAAAARTSREFRENYSRVIDGIQTFFDAIAGARQILKVEDEEAAAKTATRLTDETTAIMRELLTLQEAGKTDEIRARLSTTLPERLKDWRTVGIPALIRSRDS
jgi:hypothetical protein